MNTRTPLATLAFLAFAGCANVVHVPPGTSVEIALARKPEMLRMPTPSPGSLVADNPSPRVRSVYIPPVEPGLPTNDRIEAGAEAFTRGKDLFESGKNSEAISAFQQAVQSDPNYGEAWHNLGLAYEKAGNTQKARDAFRHSQGSEPQVQLR